jgi:hypothetical protein
MSQQTFTLTTTFCEQLFNRFSTALSELASGENLGDRIEIYNRVTREDICAFLASAFWASLSPEEGRYHSFRISLGPPSDSESDYVLTEAQVYSADQISDFAPALGTRRSIGVWYSDASTLQIWGFAYVSYWDITVTAARPGQLLFSMLAPENGFHFAVSGTRSGFIDKTRTPLTWFYLGGSPPSLVNVDDIEVIGKSMQRTRWYESIAKMMLRHRHGGTLLIVPEDNGRWRDSCSIRYESTSSFLELRENVDRWEADIEKNAAAGSWFNADDFYRQRAAESLKLVAQLTAVDGATIIDRELEVYGFGAKLAAVTSGAKPRSAIVSTPFEEAPYVNVQLSELGGTRHQSAAQFVHDHKGCVAIVCSQDGRVSAMHWDSIRNAVVVITDLEYAL